MTDRSPRTRVCALALVLVALPVLDGCGKVRAFRKSHARHRAHTTARAPHAAGSDARPRPVLRMLPPATAPTARCTPQPLLDGRFATFSLGVPLTGVSLSLEGDGARLIVAGGGALFSVRLPDGAAQEILVPGTVPQGIVRSPTYQARAEGGWLAWSVQANAGGATSDRRVVHAKLLPDGTLAAPIQVEPFTDVTAGPASTRDVSGRLAFVFGTQSAVSLVAVDTLGQLNPPRQLTPFSERAPAVAVMAGPGGIEYGWSAPPPESQPTRHGNVTLARLVDGPSPGVMLTAGVRLDGTASGLSLAADGARRLAAWNETLPEGGPHLRFVGIEEDGSRRQAALDLGASVSGIAPALVMAEGHRGVVWASPAGLRFTTLTREPDNATDAFALAGASENRVARAVDGLPSAVADATTLWIVRGGDDDDSLVVHRASWPEACGSTPSAAVVPPPAAPPPPDPTTMPAPRGRNARPAQPRRVTP